MTLIAPLVMSRPIVIANRHPRLRFDRAAVMRALAALDAAAEQFGAACPPGELSLVFLTDTDLAALHAQFLDDPTVTDVITFTGDPGAEFAGEICVSVDAAARQAGEIRTTFAAELTLYLVHGWLHLAGFDDLEPAKKRVMRRREAQAMKLLAERNLIPEFSRR